jgi:hypothetical protein
LNAYGYTEREAQLIVFPFPKPGPGWKQLAEMLFITVLFVSVLLFVVYQLAASKIEPEVPELMAQVDFLSRELATVSELYERGRARQTVLEREREIIRKANRLLREEESQRQGELNELQAELDFYRRLAGTGGEQAGLAVYEAEIGVTDSPRVFQFILTLTQNIRRASVISGILKLDVEGTLGHRPVTLEWSQLADDSKPEPSFQFKYFQQLEGYLTLPENFHPIRLLVTLEIENKRKPVIRAFDWKNLLDIAAEQES